MGRSWFIRVGGMRSAESNRRPANVKTLDAGIASGMLDRTDLM
jgi:hypothetical protein